MKRATILSLCLLLSGTALAATTGERLQEDASVKIFWQRFKVAVIRGNRSAVASLSDFPVEMSYGIPSIRNRSQMLRRYNEVFKSQTNAARCFANKQPEMDAQDKNRFSVACPDKGGNEVVIYGFQRTRAGWKFAGLDNINE